MPVVKPEPIVVGFFAKGWIPNRSPLYTALNFIGINPVQTHDAAWDGINIEYTDQLTVRRRPPFVKYCTQQLAVGEIVNQFYGTRDLNGNITVWADTNKNLYTVTPTALTSKVSKATASQGFVCQVGNFTYYSDGVDINKIDNFGNVSPWGIAAPVVAPILTTGSFWKAGSVYAANSAIEDPNGNIEILTAGAGATSGALQPVWPTVTLSNTLDGSLTWINSGPILTWAPSTAFALHNVILDTNGELQVCTTAGTSGATAPGWSSTTGATTTDNTVTWTNYGHGSSLAVSNYSWVYAYRTFYGELSTASPASSGTGPILGSQRVNITAVSMSAGVATFTGANNFIVGDVFQTRALVNAPYLNNSTFTVLASGLSTSSFSVNMTQQQINSAQNAGQYGAGTISDSGYTLNAISTLIGEGALTPAGAQNPLCNATATIQSVQITNNVATCFISGFSPSTASFAPGIWVTLSGLQASTFLNGLQVQITSSSATQFTFNYNFVNYGPTANEQGTATFNAIEIYRTSDGGGFYLFSGAVTNPAPTSNTVGPQIAGAGSGGAWTNPQFVSDPGPTNFATIGVAEGSGVQTFSKVQGASGSAQFTNSVITFDAQAVSHPTLANNTPNQVFSLSHTCSGSNRLLVVQILAGDDQDGTVTVSSVTYAGVALTKAIGVKGTFTGSEIWYLVAPSLGSNTVSVTCSPDLANVPPSIYIHVSSYNGVLQSSTLDNTATATGNNSNPSTNITTNFANELIIAGLSWDDLTSNTQVNPTSLTGLSEGTGFTEAGYNIISGAAGTFSASWTANSTPFGPPPPPADTYAHAIASFRPFPSGAPSSCTATLASNITAGSTILVCAQGRDGVPTISSNQAGTYTQLKTSGNMAVWACYNPSATAPTITANFPGTNGGLLLVQEVQGIAATNQVDQTANSAGNPTGSVTTLNANDVICTFLLADASPSFTVPSSPAAYTSLGSVSIQESDSVYGIADAFLQRSSTGTFNPSWGLTGTALDGITIAFESLVAGTGGALTANTFGLNVPIGAVNGIQMTLVAKTSSTAAPCTLAVQLTRNGQPIGSIKTSPNLTTVATTYTFGGTLDTWGIPWNYFNFNNSGFGLRIVPFVGTGTVGTYTFSVDDVNAQVFEQVSTWTFSDVIPDSQLVTSLIAPLQHLNDPPPGAPGSTIMTGVTSIAYWNGRIWMAVGNKVFFTAGPDTINGVPESCCPPAYLFTFPGPVIALKTMPGGVVVATADELWSIQGGPQTTAFYPDRYLTHIGILNPNCITQDGDTLLVYTAGSQCFEIQAGQKQELGAGPASVTNPVGNVLLNGWSSNVVSATRWAPSVTSITVHRNGYDSGIWLSNGVNSLLRYGINVGNWSPVYQPLLNGSPKSGVAASIETSPGVWTLLLASNSSNDFIYARNFSATVFQDNGNSYDSSIILGNIILSEPTQNLVPVDFISVYCQNLGSIPTVSWLPNEINGSTAPFTVLPLAQNEPAQLPASTTIMARRWPVLANQNSTPLPVRHAQVMIDFGKDIVANELLTLAVTPNISVGVK